MDVVSVIAWTCKRCGHHADGLSVEEFVALDNEHACKPEDELRRAAAYFRRRSPLLGKVADWLEHCAEQASRMGSAQDPGDCDEPESVRHALKVARATPWEEPS